VDPDFFNPAISRKSTVLKTKGIPVMDMPF